MVRPEGANVLPLGEGDASAVVDGKPASFENAASGADEGVLEPRNNLGGFGFGAAAGDVVVGQSDVEGILLRDESGGQVTAPVARIRIVITSVIVGPSCVPRAFVIRHRIVLGGGLADPKDGGHDVALPRIG